MSQHLTKIQEQLERTFTKKGAQVLSVVGLLWLLGKGVKKAYDLVDLTWVLAPKKIKNLPQRYGAGSYVIIAGATNQIGVQYSEAFALRGFNLVLIDADAQKLEALKASIEAKGWKSTIKIIVADFRKATGPEFYEDIHKQTAGLDVSVLVNNVHLWQYGPFGLRNTTHLVEHVAANLLPTVLMTREYINELQLRKPHSAVINVTLAFGDYPLANFVMQSSSTSFINYFTECLAKEYRGLGIDILLFKAGLDLFDELGKAVSSAQVQKSIEGSLTWLGRGRVDAFGTKSDDLLGFLFSNSPRFKKRMMKFVNEASLTEGLKTQRALGNGESEEETKIDRRAPSQGSERIVSAGLPEDGSRNDAELNQLRQELNKLKLERERMKEDQVKLEKEKDLLKSENDVLKRENATLTQEKSSGSQSHDEERKRLHDEKNKLQIEFEKIRTERDQLKIERDALLRDKADLQKDVNDLKGNLQGESAQLTEEKERIRAEKNKLELEHQLVKAERDQLKTQAEQLTQERDQLRGEKEQVTKEREQFRGESAQKDNEIGTLRGERDQLRGESENLKKERDAHKEDADKLRAETENLKKENANLSGQTQKLQGEKDQLEKERDALRAESDNAKAENDKLKKENEQLQEKTDGLNDEVNKLRAERDILKSDFEKVSSENELLKVGNETLQKEIETLKAEAAENEEEGEEENGEDEA